MGALKSAQLTTGRFDERKAAYGSIDFNDCIPLCRCNTFNQVLWNVTRPKEHVNFL